MKKVYTAEQYVCVTCGRTDSPEWRKVRVFSFTCLIFILFLYIFKISNVMSILDEGAVSAPYFYFVMEMFHFCSIPLHWRDPSSDVWCVGMQGPTGPKTLCNACGLRWAKRVRTNKGEEAGTGKNSG